MEVEHGYKRTEAGVVPIDWLDKTVGDLIEFEGGSQPDKSFFRSSWKPGYIRLIQIRDYKSDRFATYVPSHLVRRFCAADDIMIGRYGPPIFQILRGLSGAYNVALIKANPRLQIDRSYAYYFFTQDKLFAFIEKLSQRSSGQTGVDLKELRAFPLPLPPTKIEQETIAGALSDADALIESMEQLVAKKRQLKQGAMQKLLTGKRRLPGFATTSGLKQTEVGIIPGDWEVVSTRDACSKIQDGTHFSPQIGGNDYFYVTSKNIRFGFVDMSTASRIDATQHQAIYRRCDVKKGDLLLTKDGANTGNAALNNLVEEFSLLSSVAFLRFDQKKHLASYFLQQVLASPGQRQIQDAMAGNAITRLTLEKINKLRFPAPPTKAEQEVIATILSDMDAEIIELETKLDKVRQVKKGMMHELLTGRIRLV